MDMMEYVGLVKRVKGELGCSVLDAVRVLESGMSCGVKVESVQRVVVDGEAASLGIGERVLVKPLLEAAKVIGVLQLGPGRFSYLVRFEASLQERLCAFDELEKRQ